MTILAGNRADVVDFTPGIGVGIAKYVPKGAAETVTSSTTLQNDNVLTFVMEPGVTYEVDLSLSVQGNTAGDIKTAWSVPADATGGAKFVMGPASVLSAGWVSREDTNASVSTHGYTTAKTYHVETNGSAVREWGLISSATGGTFVLQWAQSTSNATATQVGSPSYLKYTVVARP